MAVSALERSSQELGRRQTYMGFLEKVFWVVISRVEIGRISSQTGNDGISSSGIGEILCSGISVFSGSESVDLVGFQTWT